MPALPAVNKVLRCDLGQTIGPNTNVKDRIFFAYAGAGPAVSDLNTLAATISAAWNTNISPRVQASSSLTSVELTDLTSSTGAQTSIVAAHAGSLGAAAPEAALSFIVKFRIARRYRGGHPRFYLGGVSTGELATANTWDPTYAAATVTAFAAFIAACEAGPPAAIGAMTHVNVSYFQGFHNVTFPSGRVHAVPTLRVTPLQDAVIGYGSNAHVASQRRRNQQST